MENGSAPRSAVPGDPGRNGNLPLSARLLGAGVRGARSVGRATGIDRALEVAAEEAIVAAVESEAVERALARVLHGPLVEEAVGGALESDAVKRALLEALDSELVDEIWLRLLAGEQAQRLVERIAGAPELRAAIGAQGVGLLGDIGRTIARLARRLDERCEQLARRLFFRPRRTAPSDRAGAVSRLLAVAIDAALVNLGLSALAGAVALIGTALGGGGTALSGLAIALSAAAWGWLGALYLFAFWTLAGQTPGMRFVGIALAEGRLPARRALLRLLGLALCVLTLGIGFLGIIFGERRRGWQDQLAGTDVIYEEHRPEPAPWSRPLQPEESTRSDPPQPGAPAQPSDPDPPAATPPAPPGASANAAGTG